METWQISLRDSPSFVFLTDYLYLCSALEGVAGIVLQPSKRQSVTFYGLDYLDCCRTMRDGIHLLSRSCKECGRCGMMALDGRFPHVYVSQYGAAGKGHANAPYRHCLSRVDGYRGCWHRRGRNPLFPRTSHCLAPVLYRDAHSVDCRT